MVARTDCSNRRLPVVFVGQEIITRISRAAIQRYIDAASLAAPRKQCSEQPLALAPEDSSSVTRNIDEENDPRRGLQFRAAQHSRGRSFTTAPQPPFCTEIMN